MQAENRIQNMDFQLPEFLERDDSKNRGVVAVIPAYNEERFIGSVVLTTAQYVDTVLIVDDGSTDATAFVAAAAGAKVISLEKNLGKGAALKRGIQVAIQEFNAQAIVLMDGDGQHQAKEIQQVVRPVLDGTADLVVGSRFLEIHSDIPWWRQVGQHGLTWITNSASGVHVTDSQSGFRALSPQTAHLLAFHGDGFSVESEMQFVAKEHSLRVQEVPISCVYQEPSKRNPFIHGLQVLEGILRLIEQTRPLLFFSVIALLALIAAVFTGNSLIHSFRATQQLAVEYALITVVLIVFGTISLFTGIVLHAIRSLLIQFQDGK